MQFNHTSQVKRERRLPIPDPYNPDRQIPGSWDDPLDELPLEGAWIASSSSVAPASATRTQIVTAKSLYCTNVTVDVLAGDRVRSGDEVLYIHVKPEADFNPFTGWRPVVEIPLEEVAG
ncbi:hypothetical protein [Glaciibacter superstes]|uniref:hypothetical protein n=1 Tax=Glaciibacter superstes TaxID=501023 RepID=UPI0003B3697B|nr:hypothetical protein [Glaciibacter superstes]